MFALLAKHQNGREVPKYDKIAATKAGFSDFGCMDVKPTPSFILWYDQISTKQVWNDFPTGIPMLQSCVAILLCDCLKVPANCLPIRNRF
ncbi:hypothetical protein AUP42_08075 [Thalassospira lucentensis]|uniref:Uncharacterized protein n=1 Tax=Thalassospira lucentensis TaxID=168935 RepID=A0A154L0P0_9PROT|nr:hypothetical protein AUP42_08075 [Thalassospira lucentensis]